VSEEDTGQSRRMRGFERASALLSNRIRTAGESRGFAVSKLLTHWPEVAGPEIAAQTRPVRVSYPPQGMGATLTLLTTGAAAPLIEMQKEALRQRVNACYGYNAVTKIRLTQTAPTGFAEGRAAFAEAPKRPPEPPASSPASRQAVDEVRDPGLRSALEELGRRILSAPKQQG
jgi:hypothetical protein